MTDLQDALVDAALDADLAAVKRALKKGAKANAPGASMDVEYTPLQAAADGGNEEIAKLLVAAGADLEGTTGDWSWTPLQFAVQKSAAITRCLLELGADPKKRDALGSAALHTFARTPSPEHEETVRVLIEHGADPTQKNSEGMTPAAIAKSAALKKLLNGGQAPSTISFRSFGVADLVDLDRQPPLKGLYKAFFAKLAKISNGAFAPKAVKEKWSKDEVTVSFLLGGHDHTLTPRRHPSGHFDLCVLVEVNDLLPKAAARFFLHNDLPTGEAICLSLTPKEHVAWRKHDGRKLFGAADYSASLGSTQTATKKRTEPADAPAHERRLGG